MKSWLKIEGARSPSSLQRRASGGHKAAPEAKDVTKNFSKRNSHQKQNQKLQNRASKTEIWGLSTWASLQPSAKPATSPRLSLSVLFNIFSKLSPMIFAASIFINWMNCDQAQILPDFLYQKENKNPYHTSVKDVWMYNFLCVTMHCNDETRLGSFSSSNRVL